MSDIRNILAMHAAEDLRDRLAEDAYRRSSNEALFRWHIDTLKRIDPQWERWYDESVPEWRDWLNAPIELLATRIREIEHEGECTCKPDAAQVCKACKDAPLRDDEFASWDDDPGYY